MNITTAQRAYDNASPEEGNDDTENATVLARLAQEHYEDYNCANSDEVRMAMRKMLDNPADAVALKEMCDALRRDYTADLEHYITRNYDNNYAAWTDEQGDYL